VKLRYGPYTIRLKRRFSLAAGSRTTTPAVLVELSGDGLLGYGEAALPPYRQDSIDSVLSTLGSANLPEHATAEGIAEILRQFGPGSSPGARAAYDIALHDWIGKRDRFRWFERFGLDRRALPVSSYTVGIGSRDEIEEQIHEAPDFPVYKVKLGGSSDREIIAAVRAVTDKPIRVDVNQGWADRDYAATMIEWLSGRNVELVEQPLPAEQPDDQLWLRERSALPLVADESIQQADDLEEAASLYHGVNIKLVKCGGMANARRMVDRAKALNLKVMLGCMTETTCGISAAAQLAGRADWLDLDGALLIAEDPFRGVRVSNGVVSYSDEFGNGVSLSREPEDMQWISHGMKNSGN